MNEFVEKLIARLEEKITENTNDDMSYRIPYFGLCDAIEIINELSEEYNNGWISVDDRLPTEEGSYLVVGKTGGATVTRWYPPSQFHPNGHFGGNSADYIRYWMPRPQAPHIE